MKPCLRGCILAKTVFIRVFPGYPGMSWDLQGCPGTSRDVLGLPGMSWDFQGCPGTSRVVLGPPGLSWDLQECPGTTRASLGTSRDPQSIPEMPRNPWTPLSLQSLPKKLLTPSKRATANGARIINSRTRLKKVSSLQSSPGLARILCPSLVKGNSPDLTPRGTSC